MAKYKKKRARELQHDRFRDTAISVFDRLGDRLEGKGKTILYGLVGLVLLAVLIGLGIKWRARKTDEARRALGRAITVTTTPIVKPNIVVPETGPTFSTERERSQRAVEEFQKVADKYGDPYRSEARYFIATNLLTVDRPRGYSELTELSKSDIEEVAVLSKFALAQAMEADGKLDDAARQFSELAARNSTIITAETANLWLAKVYRRQGKQKEATELLFTIADNARKAKDADGLPLSQSAAAREAATKLQELDPARYAQLAPEAPGGELPF